MSITQKQEKDQERKLRKSKATASEAVEEWRENYQIMLADRDREKDRADAAERAIENFTRAGEEMQRRVDSLESKLAAAESAGRALMKNFQQVLAMGAALAERKDAK